MPMAPTELQIERMNKIVADYGTETFSAQQAKKIFGLSDNSVYHALASMTKSGLLERRSNDQGITWRVKSSKVHLASKNAEADFEAETSGNVRLPSGKLEVVKFVLGDRYEAWQATKLEEAAEAYLNELVLMASKADR